MDQNSKEYLPGQELGIQLSTDSPPAVEGESSGESFSVESETVNPSPVESQPDSQLPPEYAEEEIQRQAGEVANLAEPDKLASLKSVALKHGVAKAVRIAQKMNDPRLLDELHDVIMDNPELKKQLEAMGKIEKL